VTEAIEKKLIQRYDQIVEKSVGQKTTEVMASLKLFILFLCQFFVCDCLWGTRSNNTIIYFLMLHAKRVHLEKLDQLRELMNLWLLVLSYR